MWYTVMLPDTCYTCYMSREMMEMDDRGNAKCQKSKRRDIYVILKNLSEIG